MGSVIVVVLKAINGRKTIAKLLTNDKDTKVTNVHLGDQNFKAD